MLVVNWFRIVLRFLASLSSKKSPNWCSVSTLHKVVQRDSSVIFDARSSDMHMIDYGSDSFRTQVTASEVCLTERAQT